MGVTAVLEEKYLDVVTGLSGSGPAYVFLLLESMIEGAVAAGLPRAQAELFAGQTIFGSAKLYMETKTHPARAAQFGHVSGRHHGRRPDSLGTLRISGRGSGCGGRGHGPVDRVG